MAMRSINNPVDEAPPIWKNQEIGIVKSVTCIIPSRILDAMRTIESKMNKALEFSLLLKGEYDNNKLYVSDEFYIPKQTVSAAAVNYEEDVPGWNGVIHRHPTGCKSFSGTDENFINSNFTFSLLFEGGNIIAGVINLALANDTHRVQLPMTINIEFPAVEISDEDFAKIKEIVPTYGPTHVNKHDAFFAQHFGNRLPIDDNDELLLFPDGEDDETKLPPRYNQFH